MQRIGVFVCWCGSNIAATVDVEKVAEVLAKEPGVVYSANYQYMCSESGQNMIKDAIKEQKLTGVVICYQVVVVEDCHFVKIIPIINSVLF